jgi:cell division protein FtsL
MKMIAVLAVLALLLLYVWERVDVIQVGYHIERLKAKKVSLERERDELRVKISVLTAPDRLAKAASEKLGMAPPQGEQIRLVSLHAPARPSGPSTRVLQVAQRTP